MENSIKDFTLAPIFFLKMLQHMIEAEAPWQ
jgi:hypothetical protein